MTNSYGDIDTVKEYYGKFQDGLNIMAQTVSSVQLCYSISWNFLVQMVLYLKGMVDISQYAYQYCSDGKMKDNILENSKMYCDLIKCFNEILESYEKEYDEEQRDSENDYLDFISHQKSMNRICLNVFGRMRKIKRRKKIERSYIEAFNDHREGLLLMCDITTTYDIYPRLMEELGRLVY